VSFLWCFIDQLLLLFRSNIVVFFVAKGICTGNGLPGFHVNVVRCVFHVNVVRCALYLELPSGALGWRCFVVRFLLCCPGHL